VAPASPTHYRTATFAFTATESARFECSLDYGPFAACASPSTTPYLARTTHTFGVRAIDAAVNADASPASWSWRVN
jgi:hypothetical protein